MQTLFVAEFATQVPRNHDHAKPTARQYTTYYLPGYILKRVRAPVWR